MVSIGGVFAGANLVVVNNFLGGGSVSEAALTGVRWGVDAADIFCGNGRVAVVYSGRSTAQDTFTANAKTAQVNR